MFLGISFEGWMFGIGIIISYTLGRYARKKDIIKEKQKMNKIKLLLIEVKDAYYGGFRTCADENNIEAVKWAIDELDKFNKLQ